MNERSIKMLFADDDAEDRTIVSDVCDELGFSESVAIVNDGEEVLSFLDALDDNLPDLIVLDVNMPRLDGKQTLQRLKQSPRYAHIRVVMLSTSANPLDLRQCMLIGASHYYTKPRSYDKYVELIQWFYNYTLDTSIKALSEESAR